MYATDKALGHLCEMFIIDTRTVDSTISQDDAIYRFSINGPRISSLLWGALDETIITGHEDGELQTWDFKVIFKKVIKLKTNKILVFLMTKLTF